MIPDIVRDERGAATAELAVSVPVVLLLVLGTVQLAMLTVTDLVVEYAAFTAARAAVVYVPADYRGEAEGVLETVRSGSKLSRIRRAAVIPLVSVSPSLETFLSVAGAGTGLESLAQPAGAMSDSLASVAPVESAARFVERYPYASMFTAAQLVDTSGQTIEGGVRTYSGMQDVTVEVTYLSLCVIPIAAHVMCSKLSDLSWSEIGELNGALGFVASPVTPGRYAVVRARMTLPLEGGL